MTLVLLRNAVAEVTFDAACLAVRLLDGRGPRADFDELKRLMGGVYDRLDAAGARVRLLFDLRAAGLVSPAYVAEWAALYRARADATERVVERTTIAASSPLTRAAVSAFLALYSTRRPVRVVEDPAADG